MVRPALHIHPERHETSDTVRYEFNLSYSGSERKESLFYECVRAPTSRIVEHLDGALCGTIVHAMMEGRDIHLHGPATGDVLSNLEEFQLAWSRWLPDVYRPVEIKVETIARPPPASSRRLISAFSGGVDSFFTLARHNGVSSNAVPRIEGVLLVHGFDVRLANSGYFTELIDRTAEVRQQFGVDLRIVRTNNQELKLQNWEHSFAAQLAACLHFFAGEFSEALIGSSEPYDALVLPWGSNPITDHLLSGGALKIVHDGAGFSRTEKVELLAGIPATLKALKVCWEGKHQAQNCGECEKCVRTQLNFLAVGVSNPPCFDAPLDLRRIPRITMKNDAVIAEFRAICDYADKHDLDEEWLRLLKLRIRRLTRIRRLSALTKKALAKLGLLEPARKLHRAMIR